MPDACPMMQTTMRIQRNTCRPPWMLASAAAMLLLLASADSGGDPTDPPETTAETIAPAEDTLPPRVIVHENRRREVPGHVAFEDEDTIFLTHLDGRLERFMKDRIMGIIRLVDPAPGQTGTVFLRNGQQRTAIVLEDTFAHVAIEIEGVRTVLTRDVVDHVELDATFEDRYSAFKASLRPDMPAGHLALCRWLIREQRLDLAEAELNELLSRHDDHEARQLLRVVSAQRELAARPEPPAKPREPERADRREREGPLVTAEDVNLIRVYEIDFARPPRIDLPRAAIDNLLANYARSPLLPATPEGRQALYRADPLTVVEELIFKLQARDLYPEIRVITEPHALNIFRQRVHNAWLMNNCATSRCHGGPDAGRLVLHRRGYKGTRVRYTNFLILERLHLDPEWPLVNYQTPMDSLIIQYGLPRPMARKPHPAARGWKPAFRGLDDRMVRRTVEWIESMMEPRMDYPVDFDPNSPRPESPGK